MLKLPYPILSWAFRSPKRLWNVLGLFRGFLRSARRIKSRLEQDNLCVPSFLIISPTAHCNLSCAGCYSRFYQAGDAEILPEELDRVIRESKELGTFFYVIAGGEPLLKKGLFDLYRKHGDAAFLLFTNGMLMDESVAKELKSLDNIAVMLSIEGFRNETDSRRGSGVYAGVLKAMDVLRRNGIFFGFSATVGSANFSAVSNDSFISEMAGHGCRMGVFVDYIPSAGGDELALSGEQRDIMRARVLGWKKRGDMMVFQLPEDEHKLGGRCFSAGYGFLHITSKGYVEPCPFVHYAAENIRDKSFREILSSPFLTELREREASFPEGKLGCILFENIDEVSRIAEKHKAVSTIGAGI